MTARPPRWAGPTVTTVAVVSAILVTMVVEWAGYRGEIGPAVADGVAGAGLLICGVIAWQRRAVSRVGPLMIATGCCWLLGTVIPALVLVHRGPLVHLHMSYPTGRLHRTLSIGTVAAAYVVALVEPIAHNDALTLALVVLITVAAIDVFVGTAGPARKAGWPALIAAVAFAATLALGAAGRLAGWDVDRQMLLLYDVVVTGVAVLLLVDLLFGRWVDSTVADLVVGLGASESVSLRDQLRRAMGDPSVVVGYWIPDRQGYVDEDGKTLDIPANDNPENDNPENDIPANDIPANDGVRTVTVIPDGHDPLAVLIHDAAVGQDPELIAAVSTAARMAMTNARLRAGIRERAVQIAESRRRIVEEADQQRQDLESRLALGPLGLLAEVSRPRSRARRRDPRRAGRIGQCTS
jgi:hypothetical protein